MTKKILAIALSALMLMSSFAAIAEGSTPALDAFSTLAGRTVSLNESDLTSDDYLDRVMADAYTPAPGDLETAKLMAPDLSGLSAVTTKDIAVYSAAKQLQAELVRNKYYRSLANVLKAEIMVNPASEENYKNIQTIFSLFLNDTQDEIVKNSRDMVRSTMTKEHTQTLAKGYSVPQDFVEFVVMNDNWSNDDISDDNEWKKTTTWNTDDLTPDSLDDYLGTDGIANTPNSPNTPNTPNTPAAYNTPNTPAAYDTPAKYNTPNTPDYNTPAKYNTPNTPDYNTPAKYNSPNTPAKYNSPSTPNTPNTPNSPNTPNTPNTPNSPDTRD